MLDRRRRESTRLVEIKVLGQFACSWGQKDLLIPHKGKELLAYLILSRHRAVPRRRMAGVLWPDHPENRSASNLSTVLWRIRRLDRSLSEFEFLDVQNDSIGVISDRVWVDFWEFEHLVEEMSADRSSRTAERAIALYQGDLLEGLDEAEWVLPERERAQRLYLQALQCHAEASVAQSDYSQAVVAYQALLRIDPFNEEACREMMLVFVRLGRRGEALKAFNILASRLRSELGTEPDIETRQLHNAVRSGTFQFLTTGRKVDSERAPAPAFVGRNDEAARLETLLKDSAGGKLRVVGIEGESGIGKTRLMEVVAKRAQELGSKALSARCNELISSDPYGVLSHLTYSPSKAETRGTPVLLPLPYSTDASYQRLHGDETRASYYEAVVEWLRHESNLNPLLLVIEDLHYCDQATLELLVHLKEQLRGARIMVILTWRHEDVGLRNRRVLRCRGFLDTTLRLGRLSRHDVHELCESAFAVFSSAAMQDVGDFVFRESEGNPMIAIEILKFLESNTDSWGDCKAVLRSAFSTPSDNLDAFLLPKIHTLVRGRVENLSIQARNLLECAAVYGRSIDTEVLSRVLPTTMAEMYEALDSLVASGFIGQEAAGFRFTHDKVRAIIYQDIPPSVRLRTHRAIWNVLGDSSSRIPERAIHAERAGLLDEAAACWEWLGDRAREVSAYRDADIAYGKALELSFNRTNAHECRFGLLEKRALALLSDGRLERAARDVAEMKSIANLTGARPMLVRGLTLEAKALLRQELLPLATERSRRAVREADAETDLKIAAAARQVLALVLYRSGNYLEAKELLSDLVRRFEALSDIQGLEATWGLLGRLEMVDGRNVEAIRKLAKADSYASGDLGEAGIRHVSRGIVFGFMAKPDESLLSLRLAERNFLRAGNPPGAALAKSLIALFEICRGDFVSGLQNARAGLPFKCGKGDMRWKAISLTNLCMGLCFLGNQSLVRRMIGHVREGTPPMEVEGNLLQIEAEVAIQNGNFSTALSLLERSLERLSGRPSSTYYANALVQFGRVCSALGRHADAADFLIRSVRILEQRDEYLTLMQALSYLGVSQIEIGNLAEAVQSSTRAVGLMEASGGFAFQPQELYWNHYRVLRNASHTSSDRALEMAHRIIVRRAGQLGDRMRRRFLTVPLNAVVEREWRMRFGGGASLRISGMDATGEREFWDERNVVRVVVPLAGGRRSKGPGSREWIEVIWTLNAAKDDSLRKVKGEVGLRRARVMRLCAEAVAQGGAARESDLARVLGVSARTIRSDIAHLRSQSCVVHTCGRNA